MDCDVCSNKNFQPNYKVEEEKQIINDLIAEYMKMLLDTSTQSYLSFDQTNTFYQLPTCCVNNDKK